MASHQTGLRHPKIDGKPVQRYITKPEVSSLKPGTGGTIFGIFDTPTRPHPNRGESLICLATELECSEDSSNDPGDAPHGASGTKLDIKLAYIQSALSEVKRATANESRHGRCHKIRKWKVAVQWLQQSKATRKNRRKTVLQGQWTLETPTLPPSPHSTPTLFAPIFTPLLLQYKPNKSFHV